ncbi:MAG: hypothetical protein COB50_04575, partial [Thiotrichales bacterium]
METKSSITIYEEKDLVKSRLLENYKGQDTLSSLLGDAEQSLENSYINLAIVQQVTQTRKEQEFKIKEEKTDRTNQLSKYKDLYSVKKSIELAKLFEKLEGDENKAVSRVLITGRAGVGKSTMSQYMAYKWSKGDLWQGKFDYVFWLPLKNLNV